MPAKWATALRKSATWWPQQCNPAEPRNFLGATLDQPWYKNIIIEEFDSGSRTFLQRGFPNPHLLGVCYPNRFFGGAFAGVLLPGAERRDRSVSTTTSTPLQFSNHVQELQKRVPSGFTVIVQPPFVVIGDEPGTTVRQWARGTVKWAVDLLQQDFFRRDLGEIIDIWLFKDKASYEKYCRRLFGETPTTPFGYYSPAHRALIMNISTGGGTLVHEIVHPFMRANFPECPAWFNEGMGSLFEQSGERNGHIVGYTNWRLAGLQAAIRAGALPSFPTMMSMSDHEFYGRTVGAKYNEHYAQARYLCYYLQERNLLVKYYREFTAQAKNDPHGIQSLKKILGSDDLATFQKTWEAFVLKLNFP